VNNSGWLSSFVGYSQVGFGASEFFIHCLFLSIPGEGCNSAALGNFLLLPNSLSSMVAVQINGCKVRLLTMLEPNLQPIIKFDSEFFKSCCMLFKRYHQFDLSWSQIHRIDNRGLTYDLSNPLSTN